MAVSIKFQTKMYTLQFASVQLKTEFVLTKESIDLMKKQDFSVEKKAADNIFKSMVEPGIHQECMKTLDKMWIISKKHGLIDTMEYYPLIEDVEFQKLFARLTELVTESCKFNHFNSHKVPLKKTNVPTSLKGVKLDEVDDEMANFINSFEEGTTIIINQF